MDIHYSDDPDLIPQQFLSGDQQHSAVIYTPAIPKDHREFNHLKSLGYHILKRAQILGEISARYKTVAIAGTHGKTTTSAMVAHILVESGLGCNAFLGGVSTNYNSNFIIDTNSNYAVVEADEYDRSFLTLHPDWAVVTSMESDHLDVYGHEDHLSDAFRDFVQQIHPDGLLIVREGLPDLSPEVAQFEYAIGKSVEISADNLRVESGAYHFDLTAFGQRIPSVKLGLPGRHNVENALAAVGVAKALRIDNDIIRRALGSFKGVKRRFEVHVQSDELVYIDDYAHHPTEIAACVGSVREMFPHRKITGVFQPHLYSRTRDFASGFAEALSGLDEVILLEIYPAREAPIEGVNADMLLQRISKKPKSLLTGEELLQRITDEKPDVLLTMGAGDIDQWVEPIKTALAS